jgi:FlaA1/EpsC-like NDP-sugar epimerase
MRNRHLFLFDLLLLAPIPFVVLGLRLETFRWDTATTQTVVAYAAFSLATRLLVAYGVGIYRFLWRHASLVELERLLYSGVTSGVITFLAGAFVIRGLGLSPKRMPYSGLLLDALLCSALMIAPRLAIRFSARRPIDQRRPQRRTVIVGAGSLGQSVIRETSSDHTGMGLLPVAFVDDDQTKHGQLLGGLTVSGATADLAEVIERVQASEVIIAVPGAKGALVRRVVEVCAPLGITPRIVPGVRDIISGNVGVQQLRQVEIADLLRREPVSTDLTAVGGLVTGKVVLVTGAGGSIGSELCRQIAALRPSLLVALDHSENQVFEIHSELQRTFRDLPVSPVIADLRYAGRILAVFRRFRPVAVFHAAAHKHVPLMEENVTEAVSNNILGTRNVVDAALDVGTDSFVLISTDKAIRPTSVMGCSKRVAEQVVRIAAKRSGRHFVSVRFGNVLGSRGSVIPTFLRQIRDGGPVTVTHPEMRRFFMTIPEAVQLVLQAGALGHSGDVFALDMGEQIRIVDLARDLIRLSGLEEGSDIEISFSGIRPGEKLYEEVFFGHEEVEPTTHPKVLRTAGDPVDATVEGAIEELIRQANTAPDDVEAIRGSLRALVPDFHVPPPGPTVLERSGRRSDQRLKLA